MNFVFPQFVNEQKSLPLQNLPKNVTQIEIENDFKKERIASASAVFFTRVAEQSEFKGPWFLDCGRTNTPWGKMYYSIWERQNFFSSVLNEVALA